MFFWFVLMSTASSTLQVPTVHGMLLTPATQLAATQCQPCPVAIIPTISTCSTLNTNHQPTARGIPSRGHHPTLWPLKQGTLASNSRRTRNKDTPTQGLQPTPSSSSPTDKKLGPILSGNPADKELCVVRIAALLRKVYCHPYCSPTEKSLL